MTGLRLGYVVTPNRLTMDRMQKVVLYTANGVNSVTQWGGVAALTGPQDCTGVPGRVPGPARPVLRGPAATSRSSRGRRPPGAFYAFLRIADGWRAPNGRRNSWAMTEFLLQARVGSSPGVIFGPAGEGYLRFSTACQRDE